jgi:hypothetical protein
MQPIIRSLQPAVWAFAVNCAILLRMMNKFTINKTASAAFAAILLLSLATLLQSAPQPSASGPEYTKDAELKLPENYRQWTYLTTGFDMSYNPSLAMGHHMFDNVFVNPESYKSFVVTGTWPDKTMLVLEGRMGQDKGSINQKGSYQGTEIMGIEAHVKDAARFPGGWAFFIFDGAKTAKMVPTDMDCYTCHSQHAAVDTTFVQFYPTLLPIAQAKATLSVGYQKETAPPQK